MIRRLVRLGGREGGGQQGNWVFSGEAESLVRSDGWRSEGIRCAVLALTLGLVGHRLLVAQSRFDLCKGSDPAALVH